MAGPHQVGTKPVAELQPPFDPREEAGPLLRNLLTRPSIAYPKTENLYTRDDVTHKLKMGHYRQAEFDLIKTWHVTEKIDGTNMRVVYNPLYETVEVRGRSDNANSNKELVKVIEDLFPLEKLQAQFDPYLGEQISLGTTVTLYGEGYGAGINKGGKYGPNKAFRVFDVCYHRHTGLDSWCQPSTVKYLCDEMDVPRVPIIGKHMTVAEIERFVFQDLGSITAWHDTGNTEAPAEGIIARTDPYLYNEHGSRIMFKLKRKDVPDGY